MKKIAILGCENSHARTFLNYIQQKEAYRDVEVVGVYSDDESAATALSQKYNVAVLSRPEDAVGKIDGLIVTARHGARHYPLAKPYLKSGIPMFIDKPITVSESESVRFMQEATLNGVRLTGGSCLRYEPFVKQLKSELTAQKILGGFVRAPISLKNNYGDFFFYSQHLVETVLELFGRYPTSVKAYQNGEKVTVVFRYPDYDVEALFLEENYVYYASASTEKAVLGQELSVDDTCFAAEFDAFYRLLNGGEQELSYKDFIAPVFVINAIVRSMRTGRETRVKEYTL
jgi:hypothetical protein